MKKEKIESLKEPPIWLTALTRAKNKENLKGKKGDIWVCGLDEKQPWCEKIKCEYCERDCYYLPENADLLKKNAKKICPVCALKKHSGDLPEDMRKILKKVVEDFG